MHTLSDQALMVATISVLYATAQFFAAPLLGRLSDRFGRRLVILYSISVSAIGYFLLDHFLLFSSPLLLISALFYADWRWHKPQPSTPLDAAV